jgi:hypothetical protein
MDSADVEQFVRGTLGCSCPDELLDVGAVH